MSNKKKVWVSFVDNYVANIYSIDVSIPNVFDFPSNEKLGELVDIDVETEELAIWQQQNHKLIGVIHKYRDFEKLDILPNQLWKTKKDNKLPQKSEYLFRITNGFVIVNEACANLLKQFNLGNTSLTPIHIHKLDSDELCLKDTFYFLNVCERKRYMAEEQHGKKFQLLRKIDNKPMYRLSALSLKDDLVAVSSDAVDCEFDLWHDPCLRGSFFLSDRLHKALSETDMATLWDMRACKMV